MQPELQRPQPSSSARQSRRYEYKPLQSPQTDIRILRLHSPDDDGLLQGELERCSLTDHPYYVALSYEWEDSGVEVEIRINGNLASIRHNLSLLLQHLLVKKAMLVKAGQFRLWADAICIDQGNLEEKRDQASVMGRIFSQTDSLTPGPKAKLVQL
jgi:hypothetical protein